MHSFCEKCNINTLSILFAAQIFLEYNGPFNLLPHRRMRTIGNDLKRIPPLS